MAKGGGHATRGPVALYAVLLCTVPLVARAGKTWQPDPVSKYFNCSGFSTNICQLNGDGSAAVGVSSGHTGVLYSKRLYMHGQFAIQFKLPQGNNRGLVAAFYLIDPTSTTNTQYDHTEIDAEFYGQSSGSDYVLHSNVYAAGQHRLVQYKLPFDPTQRSHVYTIRWNSKAVVWFVGGTPYRVEIRRPQGPWPARPMRVLFTMWQEDNSVDLGSNPIMAKILGVKITGCVTPNANTPQTGCPYATNPAIPWNRPLAKWQIPLYNKVKRDNLYAEYAWGPSH